MRYIFTIRPETSTAGTKIRCDTWMPLDLPRMPPSVLPLVEQLFEQGYCPERIAEIQRNLMFINLRSRFNPEIGPICMIDAGEGNEIECSGFESLLQAKFERGNLQEFENRCLLYKRTKDKRDHYVYSNNPGNLRTG